MIFTVVAFLISSAGIAFSVWPNIFRGIKKMLFFSLAIMFVLAIIKAINLVKRKNLDNYYRAEIKEKISTNVFASLNDVNATKIRSTLRYTYGNVHDWNPINYYKNVLVYDVHEQLRMILLSLKDVIIQTSPNRFHDDNVTVDLVYCYPKENGYSGDLPYNYSCKNLNDKFPWKLISSGDRSVSAHSIREWLESKDSFYSMLIQNGYFCCDKKDLLGRYHIDTKDKEYNENLHAMAGSIAGVVIDIKNDEPSRVLVRSILTINTYGNNLYDESNCKRVSKWEYEKIIKESVIASYKSLLSSELVQMYIRHSIREDGRCPFTGSLPEDCCIQQHLQ